MGLADADSRGYTERVPGPPMRSPARLLAALVLFAPAARAAESVCGVPLAGGVAALPADGRPEDCLEEHLLRRHAAFLDSLGPSALNAAPAEPARVQVLAGRGAGHWTPGQGSSLGLDGLSARAGGRLSVDVAGLEALFAHEAGHELFDRYAPYRPVLDGSVRARLELDGRLAYEDTYRALTEMFGDLHASLWMRDGAAMTRPSPFGGGGSRVTSRDYSRPQPFTPAAGSFYEVYASVGSRAYAALSRAPESRRGAGLHAVLSACARLLERIRLSDDPAFVKRFGYKPDPEAHALLRALIDEELGKAALPALE